MSAPQLYLCAFDCFAGAQMALFFSTIRDDCLRQQLLRELLRAANRMIQGGWSETTRCCGNPDCACHRDAARRHGPTFTLLTKTRAGIGPCTCRRNKCGSNILCLRRMFATKSEERHRQLKCSSDLAGFTSRRLFLVVHQVVFVGKR